jgi:hypothetical protein
MFFSSSCHILDYSVFTAIYDTTSELFELCKGKSFTESFSFQSQILKGVAL